MRTLYWKSLLYEYTKKKGSKRANVQTFLPKKQEIFRVLVSPLQPAAEYLAWFTQS